MKLTPIEIKNQEFKKSMRGYDVVEVDTFIELIADKYQELLEENERLVKQNLVLDTELNNIKDVERTLKTTLKNVQENSQISKENSAKEAGLIKKEAELAAAQLLEKTRLQVHKMREEVVNLQNQKHSFISRLRHLLSSQMELLEVLETDDLNIKKLKDRTKPGVKDSNPVIAKRPVINPPQRLNNVSQQQQANDPKQEENKEKIHGKDLFNDIFGDSTD